MNSGYIAILDSGIGGFSVLIETARRTKGERFLYFGDNKNAPYGNKSKSELYNLLRKNLSLILKYNVKAIIIGCNTLSVSVLPIIRPTCDVPLFGVYPPVDKRSGRTYLFATPVTCSYCKNARGITIFPLANLATDIEKNKMRLGFVDIKNHISVNTSLNSASRPETLILGCTHYFFVKKQFTDHFCPRKIYSGEEETAKRVKKYLNKNALMSKNKEFTVDFIGENAEENFNFYNMVVKDLIFQK